MPDFHIIINANSFSQAISRLRSYFNDPTNTQEVSSFIRQDPVTGEWHTAPGVSIPNFKPPNYGLWEDDDGRWRIDVRLYGPMEAEDFSSEIDHPRKGKKVRDSKTRKAHRDAIDAGGGGRSRGPVTINRKRPTYDRDGNVTGEETWATGTVNGDTYRNITILGDEYDGEFDNTLLLEHIWYEDVL